MYCFLYFYLWLCEVILLLYVHCILLRLTISNDSYVCELLILNIKIVILCSWKKTTKLVVIIEITKMYRDSHRLLELNFQHLLLVLDSSNAISWLKSHCFFFINNKFCIYSCVLFIEWKCGIVGVNTWWWSLIHKQNSLCLYAVHGVDKSWYCH